MMWKDSDLPACRWGRMYVPRARQMSISCSGSVGAGCAQRRARLRGLRVLRSRTASRSAAVTRTKLLGLPANYLQTYRPRLAAITPVVVGKPLLNGISGGPDLRQPRIDGAGDTGPREVGGDRGTIGQVWYDDIFVGTEQVGCAR